MKAVYPGSFDPVTNGHLDIIERAAKVFDRLVVAVATNLDKEPLFTVEERLEMLREACRHLDNVEVDYFHGLLVDYVGSQGAKVVIRGLRVLSDFETEFQMALTNKQLNEDIETFFMMTNSEHLFLSSRIVRELAAFGAPVKELVPTGVEKRLIDKIAQKGQGA